MHLYPIDGAVHRVAGAATPFAFRRARYAQVIVGVDPDPGRLDALRTWTREYHDALHPFSAGGGYVNMLMDDEGEDRVEAAYGDNFPRLVETKRRYDPENLWHVQQEHPDLLMTRRILVIGAGVAGSAAARAMVRCGLDVTLVERRSAEPGPGLGLNLPGNAVRALRQLGAAAAVEAARSSGLPAGSAPPTTACSSRWTRVGSGRRWRRRCAYVAGCSSTP